MIHYTSNLLAVHVEEAAHGTKAIRMDEWHKTPVGLPSPDEQRTIVKSLDQETAKIDMFITKSRAAIGRLKEYGIALISAAVIGKIDVRDLS